MASTALQELRATGAIYMTPACDPFGCCNIRVALFTLQMTTVTLALEPCSFLATARVGYRSWLSLCYIWSMPTISERLLHGAVSRNITALVSHVFHTSRVCAAIRCSARLRWTEMRAC